MAIPRRTTVKHCYKLHVELKDVTPVVWRDIWVEGQMSLIQLHHIIQAAMGWTDAHLHSFTIGDAQYATPHPEDDPGFAITDERTVRLRDVLEDGLEFSYLYDFGDGWRHTIQVEQVELMTEPDGYAYVSDGARACPPEDCGGSHSYQEFLDALKTRPKSKAVKEFLDWAGNDFQADRFDRHATNATLLRMAWNRWGER
ncbi:plasmid pRiA4b ORF-3-like protein [mine drainage metagenome]|uniref:Plasmid pRiA4b ORF-3-like protein n=1 Tax=mine drainage metagenome TaxID=410659 RepID=A0A1J5RDK1_9ZZZZ